MEERRLLDDLRIDRSARLPERPGRRRALLLAIAIVLAGAAGWWLLAGTGTPLVEVQRRHILSTLAHFEGDKKQTAAALGISLKTLYNRLKRYGTH